MSDRPSSNQPRNRRPAKRLRHRRNRLAHRLLDEAYAEYLSGPTSRNDNDNDNNESNDHSSITVLSAPSLPSTSSPNQYPPPPRSPTLPITEPDSPHSMLTLRVRPDTPPHTPSLSPCPTHRSIPPVQPRRRILLQA